MAKIKLTNTADNTLMRTIKGEGIQFASMKRTAEQAQVSERIEFFPRSERQQQQIANLLRNYGQQLYHNTTLRADMMLDNVFNYSSNQYENISSNTPELELPLYYIENENEQNRVYAPLKSIAANTITKKYIMEIASSQQSIPPKTSIEMEKMKNILFGDGYKKYRSKSSLDEFCYYNKIGVGSQNTKDLLKNALVRLGFLDEAFSAIVSDMNTINVNFNINDSEDQQPIKVSDLMAIIENGSYDIDLSNKIILGSNEVRQSAISINFKRLLLTKFLRESSKKLLKTFTQMSQNEECEHEFIIFKLDKFLDTETTPTQSFWMFDEDFKEYYDYQIKYDKIYRYELKAYTIIYGTQSEVTEVETLENTVRAVFVSRPSYKITEVNLGSDSIKVSPKILMPPFAQFLNESNSGNYVKIYLDLQNSTMTKELIAITESDTSLFSGIKTNSDDKIDFGYTMQDGKFEVFRMTEKPASVEDFANFKILDAKNKHSSTSVVFKDPVIPNKKYYYMFRAVNLIGVPSNPTPVFEVELIKDAQSSKIISKAVTLEKETMLHDKTFKSLLQIMPAFQQRVFDDEAETVANLESFDKKINDLSLGTAADKVWGKKFKIRVKSKDTGKIIDLNVKFNIIKDNS